MTPSSTGRTPSWRRRCAWRAAAGRPPPGWCGGGGGGGGGRGRGGGKGGAGGGEWGGGTKVPRATPPMLATPAKAMPRGDDWATEVKWDGVRVMARVDGDDLLLTSRNLL